MSKNAVVVQEAQQGPGPGEQDNNSREPLIEKLRRLLVRHPKTLVIGWCLVALAFLLLIPVAYIFWYLFPYHLWEWTNQAWWRWLLGFFGFLILFSVPFWVAMGATSFTSFIADLSLSVDDAAVHKAQQKLRETEDDAIARLEQTDEPGLLPLLKYSRAQLEAYYRVGLSQTRRSFINSVLAMWLGFMLLLVGVALYVGPVEKLGLKAPAQDFRILIMGGAAIIEFISALFLWVYRSSTAQLTYFYNRQMHTHTSILCFRMASTMQGDRADDTKRAIVDKVLDWTSMPEKPPIMGARGLSNIFLAGGPKEAP